MVDYLNDVIFFDNLKNYQIEPLLFIHFVENAFKYGVSPHPAQAPENSISGCLN